MRGLLKTLAGSFFDFAFRHDGIGRIVSALVISPPKSKEFDGFRVNIPNNLVHGYLVDGLVGNEKFTFDWLLEHLQDGDVFYNIGANFGFYVLAMNSKFKLKTVAFEPEALNFAELCKNTRLNGLDVVSLPIALLDRNGFEDFYIAELTAGNASGKTQEYDTSTSVDDPDFFVQDYRQRVVCRTLDSLDLEPPNVILMDIDGGEVLALRGMEKTLKNPSLRAIVVEVAEETAEEVRRELARHGFDLVQERTQRRGNEFFLRA